MDIVYASNKKEISYDFKAFINSLRCPLCKSQLDGAIHVVESRLYCCSAANEYECIYRGTQLIKDIQSIIFGNYKYEIYSLWQEEEVFNNIIFKVDLNLQPRYQQIEKKKIFEYVGHKMPVFAKNLSEFDFLKKVKLYSIFS